MAAAACSQPCRRSICGILMPRDRGLLRGSCVHHPVLCIRHRAFRIVHLHLHCALCIVHYIVRSHVLSPRHRRRHRRHARPRPRRVGRIIASATDEHAPFASPQTGWAEQDPARLVARRLRRGARGARGGAACGRRHHRRSASRARCTAPCCSTTAARSCGRRSSGAISGPRPSAASITETVGAARLLELTWNPALTGFTLPKLLWVREHEPEAWARVAARAAAEGLRALPADRRSRHRRRRRLGHAAVRRGAAADGRARCSTRWSSTPRCCREAFESPEVTGTRVRRGRRGDGPPRRARRSSPAAAIRPPAPSAWASCAPARSAPPSARPASSSPPPIGRRSIRRDASTRSATPCRAAGT